MMSSCQQWEPYVEKVFATIQLLGFDVETEEFSENLGLKPTFVTKGNWCYETKHFVTSSNVNEHLRYLLRAVLPAKSRIDALKPNVVVNVSIFWGTNIADRPGGVIIDDDCVLGLAQLGAKISFEVFPVTLNP
jgi:hypothetical protein